jgi:hypothetical protein
MRSEWTIKLPRYQAYSETETLRRMAETFNEKYPAKGMAFALGNLAKRPQTRQLLGVLRLDEQKQDDLFGYSAT